MVKILWKFDKIFSKKCQKLNNFQTAEGMSMNEKGKKKTLRTPPIFTYLQQKDTGEKIESIHCTHWLPGCQVHVLNFNFEKL